MSCINKHIKFKLFIKKRGFVLHKYLKNDYKSQRTVLKEHDFNLIFIILFVTKKIGLKRVKSLQFNDLLSKIKYIFSSTKREYLETITFKY